MKKVLFIGVALLFFIVTATLFSDNRQFVNFLRTGQQQGTEAGFRTNIFGRRGDGVDQNFMDPSGSNAWGGWDRSLQMQGGGFDYLATLQAIRDNPNRPLDGTGMRDYHALNFFAASARGTWPAYNDIPTLASAMFLNVLNQREAGSAVFLQEFLGQPLPNGEPLTVANTNRAAMEHFRPNWHAHMVAAEGGPYFRRHADETYPDGLFHIERSSPTGNAGARWRDSPRPGWDAFSSIDQANWAHNSFNAAMIWWTPYFSSPSTLSATGALRHNRNTFHVPISGVPFGGGNGVLNNMTNGNRQRIADRIQIMYDDLSRQMKQGTFTGMTDALMAHAETTAILVLIYEGWYVSTSNTRILEGTSFPWSAQTGAIPLAQRLWPEENIQTAADVRELVRRHSASYVELIHRTNPNLSIADIDRIYGTTNGVPRTRSLAAGFNTASMNMYKPLGTMDENAAFQRATESDQIPSMMMMDTVALAYAFDMATMEIPRWVRRAFNAGLPQEIGGAQVDPTNPQQFFQRLPSGQFDPMHGERRLAIYDALERLGYNFGEVAPITISQLTQIHLHLGAPYSQTANGRRLREENFREGNSYRTITGSYTREPREGQPGRVLRNVHTWDPLWSHIRATDCMTIVRIGWALGNESESWMVHEGYTGTARSTEPFVPRTTTYAGREWDATLIQINRQGQPMSSFNAAEEQRLDAWFDILQPGDIIIRGGHAETVLGMNRTSSTVYFQPHETFFVVRGTARVTRVLPGMPVLIGTLDVDGTAGIHNWGFNRGGDELSRIYRVFRPAFNINP